MRILLINWARIADGAAVGGGANGYCQGLALELARRGHQVTYLSSGMTYTRARDDAQNQWAPPRIHKRPDFRPLATPTIAVYEVEDSPVIAPSIFQFNEPNAEASAPDLERVVTEFVRTLQPDVVHFHNIEGFSAGCIDAARATPTLQNPRTNQRVGVPRVVYSLHNYHTVCPQVYLMKAFTDAGARSATGSRREPCASFENGHACVSCVRTHSPDEEIRRRLKLPIEPARASVSNQIRAHNPGTSRVQLTIDNTIAPEPKSAYAPNQYATRRAAMIAALSRCDAVLGVSSFVRAKFEALGVKLDVLREMPIGTRMIELAGEVAQVLAAQGVEVAPPSFASAPTRPIRLVFLGYHNEYKGLHVLVEALEQLEPKAAARFALHVHAKDVEPIEPRLLALGKRLADVSVERGYAYERVPWILAGKDLGVVPSVWWDNGPQTVMEYLACGVPVLGAAVGGIPDLVKSGQNGMLFRGNDVADLGAKLAEVAAAPEKIDAMRRNIQLDDSPLRTMEGHGVAIEALYMQLLGARA